MGKPRTPRGRAVRAAERLGEEYPVARCALHYRNPFELLAATILSAQCTDERVNMVTPALFARFSTPEAMASAPPEAVEELIRSAGFYKNKTRSLIGMAEAVVRKHAGVVPSDMDALVKLPGVGRKTANVLRSVAFEGVRPEGIAVDTHVARLSRRLEITVSDDPVVIERELIEYLPRKQWRDISLRLIMHGRAVCNARKPACSRCVLADFCPSAGRLPGSV